MRLAGFHCVQYVGEEGLEQDFPYTIDNRATNRDWKRQKFHV